MCFRADGGRRRCCIPAEGDRWLRQQRRSGQVYLAKHQQHSRDIQSEPCRITRKNPQMRRTAGQGCRSVFTRLRRASAQGPKPAERWPLAPSLHHRRSGSWTQVSSRGRTQGGAVDSYVLAGVANQIREFSDFSEYLWKIGLNLQLPPPLLCRGQRGWGGASAKPKGNGLTNKRALTLIKS